MAFAQPGADKPKTAPKDDATRYLIVTCKGSDTVYGHEALSAYFRDRGHPDVTWGDLKALGVSILVDTGAEKYMLTPERVYGLNGNGHGGNGNGRKPG